MRKKTIEVTYFDKKGNVTAKVIRETYKEQKKKESEYKKFRFVLLDVNGDILDQYIRMCKNKKHSLKIADFILKTSLMSNLYKIITVEL